MEEWIYIAATIAMLPAIIFALYAQIRVQSTFNKYSKVRVRDGMTAAQLAQRLLQENNCDVRVEQGRGQLTDHYDPKRKVVSLSPEVYNGNSVAAYGIAAHEVGHAIQDDTGYAPLRIRQMVISTTSVVNKMLLPLIIVGFLAQFFIFYDSSIMYYFILALVIMYALSFLINVITIPTEFNASNRAREMLRQSNLLEREEQSGASKVLHAAALTYVAGMIVSLVYFLRYLSYFIMLTNNRRK